MTDIVERLREAASTWRAVHHAALAREAADEIERLRAEFELFREAPSKLEVAQYEIERLRRVASYCRDEDVSVVMGAVSEIGRLETDCDRLREFNTKLCAEIERLRDMVSVVMSELLIAQEDNQMSSSAYRGEWLGELIQLCQRGLENREASR